MTREFFTAKFREGDKRTYTYHNDAVTGLAPGDRVRVPGKTGEDGYVTVTVVEVGVPQPHFPTKGAVDRAVPPASERLL